MFDGVLGPPVSKPEAINPEAGYGKPQILSIAVQ